MPQRYQPDSLISLIFLEASDVIYTSPVADPWFAANKPFFSAEEVGRDGENWYTADNPASTMACATKVYVCNPELPEDEDCANVLAHNNTDKHAGFANMISKLWPNAADSASVTGALRFIPDVDAFGPDQFYGSGPLPSLLTSFSVMEQLQADPIPPDRWQAEMEYSFQASLASLQAKVVETAIGTLAWSAEEDAACAPPDACRSTCKRQMIKSPRHYSFSVLGVFLILGLGGLLITVGWCIEGIWVRFVDVALRFRKWPATVPPKTGYSGLEWMANSTLQLQRLAHEGLGIGTWSRGYNAIPVTEPGEMLGVLSTGEGRDFVITRAETSTADIMQTVTELDNSSCEKLSSISTKTTRHGQGD